MSNVSALKEYLVKLGWDVDEIGYQNAARKVEQFVGKLSKVPKITSTFLKGGGYLLSFLASVNAMTLKVASSISKADIEAERFARQMWTSEKNAKSFLSALDKMGATKDDIFWMSPEEFSRFMELKNYAANIQAPNELQAKLTQFRNIGTEIKKIQLLIEYGSQWVMYYFAKFMGGDLEEWRKKIKSIGDYLRDNLPKITEKIAKFLYYAYRMGTTVIELFERVFSVIKRLFDMIPQRMKTAGTAIAGLIALFKLGPVGAFIAALTTIILLLDDFFTWQRGGKSHFADEWEKLSKLGDKIKEKFGKPINQLRGHVDRLEESWAKLYKRFKPFFDKISGWTSKLDPFQRVLDKIEKTADGIATAFSNVVNSVGDFVDLIEGKGNVFKLFKDELKAGSSILDLIPGVDNPLAQYGNIIDAAKSIVDSYNTHRYVQGSGERGTNSLNVGGISVNVTNTNATAQDIASEVVKSILNLRGTYSPFLG